MSKERIWDCSVITYNEEINELPNGADEPPRKAVIDAIESLGLSVHSISSGWGSEEFTPKIAKLNRRVVGLEGEIVVKDKRIAELEKRLSNAETMGTAEQARRDLEQQAKGIEDFFNSIDPQISMGERKLWSLQSHNVNCYLDNLRNQAKGGAE
jgi:hypothetical protein